MQPLTGPYVYGGQRIFSFCQLYFLRDEGVPEADISKRVEIRVVFGLCIQYYDVLEGNIYRPDQD